MFDNKGYKLTGDDAATYMSNVRYLQLIAKSEPVFNLGVIAGPDLMLLEQVIPNPSSLKEGLKSTFLGSAKTKLEQFKNNLNNGATAQFRVHGFEPDVELDSKISTIKNDEEYNKLPSGTVFIAPNGKKMRKP